jgi:hypothetical protein
MATATGDATWRSLRLNGNLRGRQAGVVARRAQRPYRDPTSDDGVYVPEEKHITEMSRLVGPGACPAAATACVTRTGQGLDKSGRGSRAQLRAMGAGQKSRRSAPATGGTRVAKTSAESPLRRFGARRVACALDVRALVGWRTRAGGVSGVQERRRRLGRLRRTRSTPCMLYLELSAATLEQLVVAQFLWRSLSGRWLRFRSNGAPAGADGPGFRMSAFGHGDESPVGA